MSFQVLGLRHLYCFTLRMRKVAQNEFGFEHNAAERRVVANRMSEILGKPFSSVIQKLEISNKTGISPNLKT